MPAAVAIPAVISAVAGVGGALISSNAAGNAADIQSKNALNVAGIAQNAVTGAQGGEQAAVGAGNSLVAGGLQNAASALGGGLAGSTATLGDIYGQELQNINPYLAAGQQGIAGLTKAVGPGGELSNRFAAPTAAEVQQTPGYQFILDQGTQAIMRNAAATGLTGGTLKNINQFASGTASQYYQQAYNNALNTFSTNRNASMQNLSALLGLGTFGTGEFQGAAQNAGNQIANNQMGANSLLAGYDANAANLQASNLLRGSEYSGNTGLQGAQIVGNALTGGSNAQAAGQIGQANAWNQALGGVANAAQFATIGGGLFGQGGGSPAATPTSGATLWPGYNPAGQNGPYGTIPNAPNVPWAPPPGGQLPNIFGTTPPAAYNPNSFVLPGGQY